MVHEKSSAYGGFLSLEGQVPRSSSAAGWCPARERARAGDSPPPDGRDDHLRPVETTRAASALRWMPSPMVGRAVDAGSARRFVARAISAGCPNWVKTGPTYPPPMLPRDHGLRLALNLEPGVSRKANSSALDTRPKAARTAAAAARVRPPPNPTSAPVGSAPAP